MTQPKYTNADCPLYGSEYCAALNMESCEKCTVDCTDEEKTARVKQDLADMILCNIGGKIKHISECVFIVAKINTIRLIKV